VKENQNIKLEPLIRDILLKSWDPIGIGDDDDAQDEYAHYVIDIIVLLYSSKCRCEIFDFLWHLETVHMGLKGNKEKTIKVAREISNLMPKAY